MRVWRLILRLVPAVLILGAGIAQAGARVGIWPKDSVRDFFIFGVALLIAFLQTVGTAVDRFREEGRTARSEQLDKVVLTLLHSISTETGISAFDLAVSVFERHGWRQRQVRRVHRRRVNDLPYHGGIKWRVGKGVVGLALEDGKAHHLVWRTAVNNYAKRAPKMTQAQYVSEVPEKYRSSFSLGEFRTIVDRYDELLAVPIIRGSDSAVAGVVSVDLRFGVGTKGDKLLNAAAVHQATNHAADIISQYWARKG